MYILENLERCQSGFLYFILNKDKTRSEIIFVPFPKDLNKLCADILYEFDKKTTKYLQNIYPDKVIDMYPVTEFCSCHFGKFDIWDESVKILKIEE